MQEVHVTCDECEHDELVFTPDPKFRIRDATQGTLECKRCGHTTTGFRKSMRASYPTIETDNSKVDEFWQKLKEKKAQK